MRIVVSVSTDSRAYLSRYQGSLVSTVRQAVVTSPQQVFAQRSFYHPETTLASFSGDAWKRAKSMP